MAKRTKKQEAHAKELKTFVIALVVIGLLILGLFEFGALGYFINSVAILLIGGLPQPYYLVTIALILIFSLNIKQLKMSWRIWTAIVLLFVSLILIQSLSFKNDLIGFDFTKAYFSNIPKVFSRAEGVDPYSGIIGAILFGIFSFLMGKTGTIVFVAVFVLIAIALLMSPKKVIDTAVIAPNAAKGFFAKIKESSNKRRIAREAKVQARQEDRKEPSPQATPVMDVEKLIARNYESDESKSKPNFMTLDEPARKPEQIQAKVHLELDEPQETSTASITTVVSEDRPNNFDSYRIPPITLLDPMQGMRRSTSNDSAAKEKSKRLLEVLSQFGIEASLIDIHIGPAVTKFELKPDSNVKISKISSIQDNLMMELAVKTLRIEAPIPGKSAVGIEIPNEEMIPVRMKDIIMKSDEFMSGSDINVTLGKDLMGNPITIALNKMPHLLIAGATGSGKSVCMNSIITSIILSKRPDELQLVLVDPKKVEFTPYVNIPHLIAPVISDPMQAAMALKVVVDKMDDRYDLFSKAGVRNISAYNQKVKEHPEENKDLMPWIVVIIDELADLMAVAGKDVELSIQRITQLARAAGIHLIVATQRPSVDVVTGIIKANIPSRIAFAVSSAIDSRTILDTVGAEKLLGYGDMLYIPMGEPNPMRVQGVYVSDDEVKAIAQRASEQAKPRFDDAFVIAEGSGSAMVSGSDDPLYEEAYNLVVRDQKASTSWLQRQLKVGYNRAANLMDTLEQNGVIGPAQGSRARIINVQLSETEEAE